MRGVLLGLVVSAGLFAVVAGIGFGHDLLLLGGFLLILAGFAFGELSLPDDYAATMDDDGGDWQWPTNR